MASDVLRSRIRTAWPMVVGVVAAYLFDLADPVRGWLAGLGIEVTETQVAVAVGAGMGLLVYEAGRWLERRTWRGTPGAVARGLGRLLLSLGLPMGQPVYAEPGDRVRVVTSREDSHQPPVLTG